MKIKVLNSLDQASIRPIPHALGVFERANLSHSFMGDGVYLWTTD